VGGIALKRLLAIAAALLLAAMISLPAYAEPEPLSPFDEPPTQYEIDLSDDELFLEEETVPETTTRAPATTIGIVPIMEDNAFGNEQLLTPISDELPLLERAQPMMVYAAFGLSLLALLLAVVALAKSGGKKSANATGNYKKYF